MLQHLPESKTVNSFVSSITDYLITALRHKECRAHMKQDLEYLFSQFLIKHMTFTADDLEEFDADEIAFIKMDLEENDKETRRRNCFNLVKRLNDQFPEEVKILVGQLQSTYCDEYNTAPDTEWGKQILVINFVIATTISTYSIERGATKIMIESDVLESYFNNIVVPEITSEKADMTPILTSQCIKFIIMYRNFVPQEWLPGILEKM